MRREKVALNSSEIKSVGACIRKRKEGKQNLSNVWFMKMARKLNMNEILLAVHKFLLGRKIKKKFKTKKKVKTIFIYCNAANGCEEFKFL